MKPEEALYHLLNYGPAYVPAFYRNMERVGGFGGKADQLNAYFKSAGTPDFFDQDLARYRAVTAAEVQAAVDRYLPKDRRVELSVISGEKR